MSRRRGIMSEGFKDELAKDLGFYDVVQREGWEGIRTKDAGNMVKRAIQIAQEHLAKQHTASAPANYGQSNYTQTKNLQPTYNQPGYSQTTYNQPIYNSSNQNQSAYSAVNTPQSYSQSVSNQNVYGGTQQAQSTSAPTYKPNTYISNNFATSYPNQPNAAVMNQIVAGSQQVAQVEQRPY